ncbi:MAG: hypothetical protein J6S21_07470, partial [Victivallales bacterium]|nr:hypothetical protein [Victivallales bacterium]
MKKHLSIFALFLGLLCTASLWGQETYINRDATPDYRNDFEKEGIDGGLTGKALLIGRNEAGRRISMTVGGRNLPKNGGSILFWVKPLDWDCHSKTGNRLFVDARGPNGQMFIVNSFATRQGVNTLIITNKQGTQEQHIRVPSIDWERNEWHQVVVSYDEESFRIYLDGTLKVAQKAPLFAHDFLHFFIGGDISWDGGINGNSLVDEFQIFNTPLADDMIQHLYMKFAKDFPARSSTTITVNRHTPVLDGQVTPGEYAFGGSGFNALSNAKYSRIQSRYFLSHDDKFLYAAMRTEARDTLLAKVTERDGSIWEDDSIELHLITPRQNYHQFILNSIGTIFDARAEDRGWNGDGIQVKNSISDGIWTLEAAIPLTTLGVTDGGEEGEWRINIGRSHLQEKLMESLAPCRGRFAQKQLFAKMLLGKSGTAVDITSLGNLNTGEVDFTMTAYSAGADTITASLKTDDKRFPFEWSGKTGGTAGGAQLASGKQSISDNATLAMEIISEQDGRLFSGRIQCERPELLVFNYIYTDIDKQILNIVCRRSDLSPASLKVTLFKRGTQQEVWSKTTAAPDKTGIVHIPFPIDDMPPGRYDMTLEAMDSQQKSIFVSYEYYFKPDGTPEWMKDKDTGVSHTVPAPWTRPTAGKNYWECWGRTYRFGGKSFISSIVTKGEELLAAPIRFRVNGDDTNKFTTRLQESLEDEATYRISGKAGNLAVEADVRAEFDGFVKFDLTLTPEGPVDSVVLEIPLRGDMVDAFDNNQTFWVKHDFPADAKGPLYSNLADMPSFWIGNQHRGLIWGAKNLKGWHTRELGKSLEITRVGDRCLVKLLLADTALPRDKARRITFYLNATPVKPLNQKYKNFHQMREYHSGVSYWTKLYETHLDEHINQKMLDGLKKRENKYQAHFHYTTSHAASPRSPEWNYYCWDWHSPLPALGDYASDAKGNDRNAVAKKDQHSYTYACLASESFFWFKLNNLARMIHKHDLRNLYTDISWPKICSNPYHGCGW